VPLCTLTASPILARIQHHMICSDAPEFVNFRAILLSKFLERSYCIGRFKNYGRNAYMSTPSNTMLHLKGSGSNPEKPEKSDGSTSPPAYSVIGSTFASVNFYRTDCLQTMQLPQKDIDGLRGVIKESWPKGIQKEQLLNSSCYEFKLHGNPWSCSPWSTNEVITHRIITREIFAYLFSAGWVLQSSSSGIFIYRQQQTPSPECDWISLTWHGSDRLRLIGASTELIATFRDMLKGMELLQDECWLEEESNAWEFKIKGYPWWFVPEGISRSLLLLLRIMETLDTHGWSLFSDTRRCTPETIISNGWYCVKAKGWVPGMMTVRA
jgi:hypothetical protein